jgi:hypothetical protein
MKTVLQDLPPVGLRDLPVPHGTSVMKVLKRELDLRKRLAVTELSLAARRNEPPTDALKVLQHQRMLSQAVRGRQRDEVAILPVGEFAAGILPVGHLNLELALQAVMQTLDKAWRYLSLHDARFRTHRVKLLAHL